VRVVAAEAFKLCPMPGKVKIKTTLMQTINSSFNFLKQIILL
jgi:hypothetical protein